MSLHAVPAEAAKPYDAPRALSLFQSKVHVRDGRVRSMKTKAFTPQGNLLALRVVEYLCAIGRTTRQIRTKRGSGRKDWVCLTISRSNLAKFDRNDQLVKKQEGVFQERTRVSCWVHVNSTCGIGTQDCILPFGGLCWERIVSTQSHSSMLILVVKTVIWMQSYGDGSVDRFVLVQTIWLLHFSTKYQCAAHF